jgi:hypothetical protein
MGPDMSRLRSFSMLGTNHLLTTIHSVETLHGYVGLVNGVDRRQFRLEFLLELRCHVRLPDRTRHRFARETMAGEFIYVFED